MEPIPENRNEGEPDKNDGSRGKNANQGDESKNVQGKDKNWADTPGEWQEYVPQSSNEQVPNFNFKDQLKIAKEEREKG